MIGRLLLFVALMTLLVPASAEAAKCLGQKAEVIKRSGRVTLDRYQAVLLTGSRVNVSAAGDNRVCSTKGDVKLTFGKGRRNRAALGSGNDSVTISSKAKGNFIDLGDGNNRIKVKNKAVTHSIKGGSGRDSVVIAYEAVNALVNTGGGNDKVVLAAKATRQKVSTGHGDDRITIQRPAKTNNRKLNSGLGDDVVRILAKGNTTSYLSDRKNPKGLSDTDTYSGGPSNDMVYDYFGGNGARRNLIDGNGGVDYLRSLGKARSEIHGGDGTDFLFSASSGVTGDRIFGDRGNDRLRADRNNGNGSKGAYLDGGDGDDWVYGTDGDDLIVSVNGIEKVYANGGDDTIVKTGNGIGTVVGGGGYDTLSYAAHTPPGYLDYSGVFVDLGAGVARNSKGNDKISAIEHLIGSPFDDVLLAAPGSKNEVDGGLGNDEITGFKGDAVDGGLGRNECAGGSQLRCNGASPGVGDGKRPILDIGQEGILTVIGSSLADDIEVGYDPTDGGAYEIESSRPAVLSRDCREATTTGGGNRYLCPAAPSKVSAGTLTTGGGDDKLTINYSVPASVSLIVNGGGGDDRFTGGKNREIIFLFENVRARAGNDQTIMAAGGNVRGGIGSDTVKVANPCWGGFIDTGVGNDNVVFAGAPRGVNASLATRKLKWKKGKCAKPVRVSKSVDGFEGSKYNDVLTVSPYRRTSLLGRDGNDIFRAKNGIRDAITTGGGGRGNRVFSDSKDKVTWGWGFAAF